MLNKIRNFKLLLEFCIYDFYFGKVELLVDHFEEKETCYQTSYFACTVTSLQHGQLPACFYSELRKSEYKRRVWNPSEVHGLGSYFKRRVTLFEKGMYPPMKGVSVRVREGKRSTLLRKAVGRCFRLGGPSAESARTVQMGPGACSRKIFDFWLSETRFPAFWGQFWGL